MLLSISKNEILYSLYISSFEQLKKILNKKDQNYPLIQSIIDSLNKSPEIISDINKLKEYSLILINPSQTYNVKILEIILKTFEEIIKEELVNDIILQKMSHDLILNINNFLQNDNTSNINIKLAQKILLVLDLIFNDKNIFIHNIFRNIIQICVKISYLYEDNNKYIHKIFFSFVNQIFNHINKKDYLYINNIINNKEKNNVNYFSFITQKYTQFLIDLIEIQNSDNNNIIDKYISIINNNNKISLKEEIELLNLSQMKIYNNINNNIIGKYGWCILCRKTANNWSKIMNFPICDNNKCENCFRYILYDIYYLNDYYEMILYLSKIKYNTIKTSELYLDIIKEMLNKGIIFLKNDQNMLIIIKEIFKDCIIKNIVSQNLSVFKSSLDLFNIIYINYRNHLKDEIELFYIKIFINFLESEKRPYSYKETILNNFNYLLEKIGPNFLIELYINYDCDSKKNAVFCVLINLFTKIMNGLYQQNKYAYSFNNKEEIKKIQDKCFDFINKYVNCLSDYVVKKFAKKDLIIDNDNSDVNIEKINFGKNYEECKEYLSKNKIIILEESFNNLKKKYIEDFNNNALKQDYSNILSPEEKTSNKINDIISFISNTNSEKISDLNYIDYISYEIANFIFINIKKISLVNISLLLYDENDINKKILYYYIYIISKKFGDKNVLESIRFLFSFMPFTSNEKKINDIILIFGDNFYEINKNKYDYNNINIIYYISFYLFLINNNINSDIMPRISLDNFLKKINLIYQDKIYDANIYENYYNEIMKTPIKFYNNSNNNEYIIKAIEAKKFCEFSWNNFLYIYTQSINESLMKVDRKLFYISIDQILIFAKICGILNLEKPQETYLNTILNMINLKPKENLNETMIEVIIKFMNYINDNCQYIITNWDKILELISILEYYLLEPENDVIINMRNSSSLKYSEKDIKFFIKKRNELSLNISDAVCESIFCKSELFKNDIIILFIQNLCLISQKELDQNFIPRLFSLNKIIEITHFNVFRSQFFLKEIWLIISNYLGNILIKYNKENIWKQALDSIKQIIGKILELKEIFNYKFQTEIFLFLENIFNKANKINIKQENIFDIIYFIIASHGKNIKSGWYNILKLIKQAFIINNTKINENIKKILKYFIVSGSITSNNDLTIFEEFIKCLCLLYNDKNLKQFSFEIIIEVLEKIWNKEKDNNNALKMPGFNNVFNFMKIFFYNIDCLMKKNIIEYYNLFFEILIHNKNLILSKNLNSLIYLYLTYFKPSISIILLSHYENRFSLLSIKQEKNEFENSLYYHIKEGNEYNIIKKYISLFIDNLINDFNKNESKEYDEIFYEKNIKNKNKIIGFISKIKNEINENQLIKYLRYKKDEIIINFDENNFELSIKYFLEKFKNLFIQEKNDEDEYIKYDYFYSDLMLTMQELSIFNINSELIYKLLFKIISLSINNISLEHKYKLINNNINILKILAFSEFKDISKIIKYLLNFAIYFLDFIQIITFDFTQSFLLISKLFNNILKLDFDSEIKIINSSGIIVLLMKLQDIQLFILKQTEKKFIKKMKSEEFIENIINLNKIYEKYLMNNNENNNSIINKIFIFEVENILPKFIEILNNDEIENFYLCLINLIGSFNHNIRNGAKNLIKYLIKNKIIDFISNNKLN